VRVGGGDAVLTSLPADTQWQVAPSQDGRVLATVHPVADPSSTTGLYLAPGRYLLTVDGVVHRIDTTPPPQPPFLVGSQKDPPGPWQERPRRPFYVAEDDTLSALRRRHPDADRWVVQLEGSRLEIAGQTARIVGAPTAFVHHHGWHLTRPLGPSSRIEAWRGEERVGLQVGGLDTPSSGPSPTP
jgi:hypothetical protein